MYHIPILQIRSELDWARFTYSNPAVASAKYGEILIYSTLQ